MDFGEIGSKFSERHDHGDGRIGGWDNDAQTFGFVFKPEFIFKEMEYYPPPVGGRRSFSSSDCHNCIHVRPWDDRLVIRLSDNLCGYGLDAFQTVWNRVFSSNTSIRPTHGIRLCKLLPCSPFCCGSGNRWFHRA